jgi:hypothetical protein
MEASVDAPGRLEGDKAQRIIEAMRASVATRGAARSSSTGDVLQVIPAESANDNGMF